MKCEYCDNEIPYGVMRCPSCGASVTMCGMATMSVTPIAAAPRLNEKVVDKGVVDSCSASQKSRFVYVLLGIFLGILGIHNFYVGRINRAVGQLLTTVLVGWLFIPLVGVLIWVLVDVCAIATDGDGNKLS